MSMQIPATMQAAVYRGANDLRLETVPVPPISSDEMLVKVGACGVCPTDIKKIQYATVLPPRIFGHETAGTIVRLGARVRKFRVGQPVALHHHVPCMRCHACRHRAFAQCAGYKRTGITAGFEPAGGGYAEYVRVLPFVFPGIVRIPAKNALLEGAMLEPVNTVLKAVRRLPLLRGDNVVVLGQGPIGLLFTALLNLLGANVLATDFLEPRLKLARAMGAKWVLRADDPKLVQLAKDLGGKLGFDAAIVCAPSDDAVLQAQQIINGAGKVLLFAHTRRGALTPLDLAVICVDEKDLIGSYSSDFTLQAEVARLVFSRRLDVRKVISHQFPLTEAAAAIHLAAHPTPDSLKIVVCPSG
jgi:L-iditol 2-dehydrogenase